MDDEPKIYHSQKKVEKKNTFLFVSSIYSLT